jgi:uncharacterized membrane protein
MSILDQLKSEADSKRESEFAAANMRQHLESEYQTNILPRMQKMYGFLKEIVEHLSYLDKAIEIADYSHDYPQIGALTQTDYKINTDGYGGLADFNRIMQINVLFNLVGTGSFSYTLEGKTRIEQEIAFLIAKSLKPDWNQYIANGIETATFSIKRKIPVRFRFEVDYNNSKIKLLIHNHENFNVYKKTFEPSQITDSLLDEVIRFMLRKDSDFIQLDIASQDKQRIKKKAEEEQLLWAKQLEEIKVEEAKEKEKKEDRGSLLAESVFFTRIKAIANKKIL